MHYATLSHITHNSEKYPCMCLVSVFTPVNVANDFVAMEVVDGTKIKQKEEMTGNKMSSGNIELSGLHAFVNRIFSNHCKEHSQSHDSLSTSKDPNSSLPMDEILNQISNLVTSSNSRYKNTPDDKYNSMSILAHNIRGYLRLLNEDQTTKIIETALAETGQLISSLFGVDNGFFHFHEDRCNGLLRVCKLALYMKFAKYGTDGFTALYTRPPVIYVSGAAPVNFGKELRVQLGLPQSSICKVPCNTMFGSPYTMDVAAFERLLTDDVSCGKTPLLLIAFAGTPGTGHTDNLGRLREICTQSGVWLHIEGDSLATLALSKVPPSISAAISSDSFTLNLPTWFGTPNIPYCTTYKTSNPSLAEQSGLVPTKTIEKLACFPLWMLLKSIGLDELRSCITKASDLAQQLSHRIDMVSGAKRLEQANVISPTVVFKYKASPALSYTSSNSLEDEDDDENVKSAKSTVDVSPKLCDSLNEILADHLQQLCGKVAIKLTQISREGSCIAFDPLQSSRALGTDNSDVDQFVEELEQEIIRLDSTLISRSFFQEAFQTVPDVLLIDSSDSPVVGAFQCIPKYWKVKATSNLSDSKKREANELNRNMLLKLSQDFNCLSEGKTPDGQIYVRVGVIDEAFDVNTLAETVKHVAEELEDNTKFLETMSDAIQKSIHEAEAVLQKESEEKFFEEGVLRHVPLIGSVFSWLSPPSKESHGVTGRAFNLASGKLQSTEKTYRYKMQLQGGEDAGDSTKATSSQAAPSTSETDVDPPEKDMVTPDAKESEDESHETGSSVNDVAEISVEETTEEASSKEHENEISTEPSKESEAEDDDRTQQNEDESEKTETGEEVKESDV